MNVGKENPLTNNGIINVYGELNEGKEALKQTTADAVIYVFDDATLSLQPYATCGVIAGNIMPTKDATVTGNNYAPISAEVTASTDLTTLNSEINTYIMKGNFTLKSSDPDKTDKYAAKKLVFEGGTITIEDGYTFTAQKVVWFNENTTLKNSENDLTTATGATFKFGETNNDVNGCQIVVKDKVTLDLNSKKLRLKDGASVKKEGGTMNGTPDQI